tara:strand:+ start:149 stop:595 length:447 start_codon:yes stop_codon:yes gene_type:complete
MIEIKTLTAKTSALKFTMEKLIATETRRLVAQADVYVFALYEPGLSDSGPADFKCYQRERGANHITIDVRFDFEGVEIWYICRRQGDTFTVRHIMAHISSGKFQKGKVASFEGFWDEFQKFVAEDRRARSYNRRLPRAADLLPPTHNM